MERDSVIKIKIMGKEIINRGKKQVGNFFIFILSGLVFVLITKASMNLELFLSEFGKIIFKELLFLVLAYFANKYLFVRIKGQIFSYISYYFSIGLIGLIFIEYLFNKNTEFGFFVLFFLFLLKALEASVAKISIDHIVNSAIRESFLKNMALAYLVFISISIFFFFILSSKLIWSFGFVLLNLFLTGLFIVFLYRIKIPKKEKIEKPLFDDVSFY